MVCEGFMTKVMCMPNDAKYYFALLDNKIQISSKIVFRKMFIIGIKLILVAS